MKTRFLPDENRSPLVLNALRALEPAIDVLRIGNAGAPPLGTLDPDVLLFCEVSQRALITNNRRSMPGHIADHLAAGHHHWGVFRLTREFSLGELAEQIHLIWAASEAEEWIDRFEYLPY
ncbi:MAG TPA: DUF5615 family PIN-like protein [Ktedonobacterales bacterium]